MSEGVKTKFSIYKIDNEKIRENLKIENGDVDYLLDRVFKYILGIIKNKELVGVHKIENHGFWGMYFKSINSPDWSPVISGMLSENELKPNMEIENIHASYIIFYIVGDSIYACTGGLGSHYIKKFKQTYFGLYLIPKLFDKKYAALKKVIENDLVGKRMSKQFTNRHLTNFLSEEDLGVIYKQMNIEIDRTIAEQLGIQFNENESDNKKININNKDSLVIRRSVSILELKDILLNLNRLESKADKFSLSYFVPVSKMGIKNTTLRKYFIDYYLYKEKIDVVDIIGDDYESYYFNSSKFIIIDRDYNVVLEQDTPFEFHHIIDALKENDKLYKKDIKKALLKWRILTEDNDGNELLFPIKLYDALQGFIEKENETYYLMNGRWYQFNNKYSDDLKNKYIEVFDLFKKETRPILDKYELFNNANLNENDYNENFLQRHNIIFSHTVLIKNVELADLIFWNEDNLYLMHNKMTFDGSGVRDVTNQVLAASELIYKFQLFGNKDNYETYYEKIKNKNKKEGGIFNINKKDFLKLFNKNIIYLVGFIENYRRDTRSTYGKYLVVNLNKQLNKNNHKLLVSNLT